MVLDPVYIVGLGGTIGALIRYSIYEKIKNEQFPVQTVTVNVLGSFLLGLVTASGLNSSAKLFLGSGLCGALTTFSSFAYQTFMMGEETEMRKAGLNVGLNIVLCALAATAGLFLASYL